MYAAELTQFNEALGAASIGMRQAGPPRLQLKTLTPYAFAATQVGQVFHPLYSAQTY